MTTYLELLKATEPDLDHISEPAPLRSLRLDEIEVQSLWFAGHFPDQYHCRQGRHIKIISPGEWNRGAGPDFIEATIEIDGELKHGPIELDLEARNWELHGHSQSESFNEVILHVALEDEGATYFTRSSNDRDIPRIVIQREELTKALGLPRLSQALARPGRCLQPLSQLPEEAIHSLLHQAALHRAQLKAARFNVIARRHGFAQALWENFADSLGFSANRLPMRLLAQRLSLKRLTTLSSDEVEAVIFGTAGFLSPELHEEAPIDSREWLEALWTQWWKLRHQFEFPPERSPAWKVTGSRPGNHPQRRLAALSCAFSHWRIITQLARQGPPFKKAAEALSSLTHDFWDSHHTLKSRRTEKPIRLLGKSRLEEFLINTLYPLSLVENSSNWTNFSGIRASKANQKVKRCSERLFGSLGSAKPYLKYAWQHQALLQIYQDFCLEDLSDCLECPFPEQITLFK